MSPISPKRPITATLALAALSLATGGPSRATAGVVPAFTPPLQMSESVPRAVGVYVTKRGQRYFKDSLQELVFRQGYELTDGGAEAYSYRAAEPIDLERLPLRFQDHAVTLGAVRDTLRTWLKGFRLADPMLTAEVANIGYAAEFRAFGIRIDHEATRRTMNGRGVVILFEAEIPRVRVEAERIRGQDLANPFLGAFGADHLWAEIRGSEPLRITVPMSIGLDSRDETEFKVLDIETNLNRVRMDMGFDRPLTLPSVQVIVNGKRMAIKQDRVEQELVEQKARLLALLQEYLAGLIAERVPTALNTAFIERYARPFSDLNEMDPPGATTRKRGDKYRWGIKPEDIHVTPDHLAFGMSAFIDDPLSPKPHASVSRRLTKGGPRLAFVNPASYDAAVVVNQDLVNRVLGLGYRRGYTQHIEVDDAKPLRVLEAPEFRFNGTKARDRGRLHLKVQHDPHGLRQNLAMSGKITFEFDGILRLVSSPDGKISVLLDEIDASSLRVDTQAVRFPFNGAVREGIRDKLVENNKALARKPKVLVDKLPIPSQFAGVPIRLKSFQADPAGYLVLYFEYNLER